MYFDTHAHYDDHVYDEDRHEVLTNAYKSDVDLILNASSDIEAAKKGIEIAKDYPFVYASVGVHPHESENFDDNKENQLRTLVRAEKVVAVGEIGLDYHFDNSPERSVQKECFARQINIAKENNLPVIIHSRDASADTLDVIKAEKAWETGGVFHCYSGSYEMAKILLDMGFYFSFGGIITFRKAERPKEVARLLPMDRLLLETDCPYLAPEPYRGRRNDSSYMNYIVAALAEIKGISTEEAGWITRENGVRLFKLNEN